MTAEQIKEFKRKLFEGPVEFSYYKILKDSKGKPVKDDGGVPIFDEENLQTARGTLKPDLLPVKKETKTALEAKPEGEQQKAVENAVEASKKAWKVADSIVFYDLEKKGWRTVKEGGLVDFK